MRELVAPGLNHFQISDMWVTNHLPDEMQIAGSTDCHLPCRSSCRPSCLFRPFYHLSCPEHGWWFFSNDWTRVQPQRMNHDTNNHLRDVQNFKCMRLVATLLKSLMKWKMDGHGLMKPNIEGFRNYAVWTHFISPYPLFKQSIELPHLGVCTMVNRVDRYQRLVPYQSHS
jgi:hypothetical protein